MSHMFLYNPGSSSLLIFLFFKSCCFGGIFHIFRFYISYDKRKHNNNSNNTNNNKNNTTANTKPSNKTTASKKPTKRALLPVEKMTGSLKSVKSPAKSTLAITWKKLRKVTGYQVQFCAKSNFKKGTIERKFKQKVTKTKVRPLKSKKKYYVRMRPYTKSGSKTYYGKWSKVKSVKIK